MFGLVDLHVYRQKHDSACWAGHVLSLLRSRQPGQRKDLQRIELLRLLEWIVSAFQQADWPGQSKAQCWNDAESSLPLDLWNIQSNCDVINLCNLGSSVDWTFLPIYFPLSRHKNFISIMAARPGLARAGSSIAVANKTIVLVTGGNSGKFEHSTPNLNWPHQGLAMKLSKLLQMPEHNIKFY